MFKHQCSNIDYVCAMSIEKDLQQNKPFKSEKVRGIVNLVFTSKYVESAMQKHYKEFGVTVKQYNILRIVRGATGPISTQSIRERMIDRMSDISRIVDRMIVKGLLTKCVREDDKRLVDISLTEKGRKKLDDMKVFEEDRGEFIGNISVDEARELNRILDKIRGYH